MDFGHCDRKTRSGERYLEGVQSRDNLRQDARVIDVGAVLRHPFVLPVDDDLVPVRKASGNDELVPVRRVLPCDLGNSSCGHKREICDRIRFRSPGVRKAHDGGRSRNRRRHVRRRPDLVSSERLKRDKFYLERAHGHVEVVAFLEHTIKADRVAFVVPI